MESLGKELDLDQKVVNQGITVLGNKGSTDQHSYVQQLRDGLNNFFVVFIEVLEDGSNSDFFVEDQVTVGDFLQGSYLGTRQALAEKNRESLSITIKNISAQSVGMLIGLFERTIGFYASLININAYHQPGVEAGKKAAEHIVEVQRKILSHFSENKKCFFTAKELSQAIKEEDDIELIVKIIQYLEANPQHQISKTGTFLFNAKFGIK
jgi:glucose-6-phosphate isomerase